MKRMGVWKATAARTVEPERADQISAGKTAVFLCSRLNIRVDRKSAGAELLCHAQKV